VAAEKNHASDAFAHNNDCIAQTGRSRSALPGTADRLAFFWRTGVAAQNGVAIFREDLGERQPGEERCNLILRRA